MTCRRRSPVDDVVDVGRLEVPPSHEGPQGVLVEGRQRLELPTDEAANQRRLGDPLLCGAPIEGLVQVVIDADLQPLHPRILHHFEK